MKSVNISEVFCEILGGVSVFVYLIPLIDLLGLANLDESFHFIADNLSASGLAIVVVVAYLLGLLMDAVGLVADEMLFDKLHSEDPPTAANRKAFWKNAILVSLLIRRRLRIRRRRGRPARPPPSP